MKHSFVLFLVLTSFVLVAFGRPSNKVLLTARWNDLEETLRVSRPTSIEEAVSLLDDQFFKKSQYALVFDSLSPQTSSPEAPRVLLFGKDKKLRLGFNHLKKDGRDLEVIHFVEATQTWEFREVKFGKRGPVISQPNPNLCIQCHDDFKPKFQGPMMQALRRLSKRKLDISAFTKKVKTDPIFRRLQDPPKTL
ncbi:MAG: hypothetical protein AAF203_03480 [Pseudomonadota bacterium]